MILPFCEEVPVKSYVYYSYPLGVLLAGDTNCYPWILNHFIQLQYNPTGQQWFDYSEIDYSFWPVMETHMLSKNLKNELKHELSEYIIDMLKNGYYSDVSVDIYFIPEMRYGNNHRQHQLLIYGYDEQAACVLTIGYISSGLYKKFTIPTHVLQKATSSDIFKRIKFFRRSNLADTGLMEININIILQELDAYLGSYNRNQYIPEIKERNMLFGIAAVEKLQEHLKHAKSHDEIDIRAIYLYWEHKCLMADRIRFLKSKYNFDLSEVEAAYNDIAQRSRLLLNIVLKHRVAHQVSLLERACALLDVLHKDDILWAEILKNSLISQ